MLLYIFSILEKSLVLYVNRAFDREYSNLSAESLGELLSAIG
jgi:hypothetical protein